MRQFQGSLGPFQEFQPKRDSEALQTSSDAVNAPNVPAWLITLAWISSALVSLAVLYGIGRVIFEAIRWAYR